MLVLRERPVTMELRVMLVFLVLADPPVLPDPRFVNANHQVSLYGVPLVSFPTPINRALCSFRVPLETLAPRELAEPLDLL